MTSTTRRPAATGPRRRPRERGLVALLLVIGTIAALGASVAVWLDRQAISDRGWADTSPRLIADPSIRLAVGTFAVDQLLARTDLAQQLRRDLPPALAATTLQRLRTVAQALAARILATAPARTVWNAATGQAHEQLLAVLDHDGTGGAVRLDLTALLERMLAALRGNALVKAVPGAAGLLTLTTPHAGQITVLTADQVQQARTAVNLVRDLATALPLAALGLFAGALALADGRRFKGLAWVGVCLALVAGVVLLGRSLAAPAAADALVATPAYRRAAHSAWLIGTSQLRDTATTILVGGGILVALGAGGWVLTGRRRSVASATAGRS